jgi:hypothetical protein
MIRLVPARVRAMFAHCFPMHVRKRGVISKPINLCNRGYHMPIVLYFGATIRSSFGGVSEHNKYNVMKNVILQHMHYSIIETKCTLVIFEGIKRKLSIAT